jgi:hypothetical protein
MGDGLIPSRGNEIVFAYARNRTDHTSLWTLDQRGSIEIVGTLRFWSRAAEMEDGWHP